MPTLELSEPHLASESSPDTIVQVADDDDPQSYEERCTDENQLIQEESMETLDQEE